MNVAIIDKKTDKIVASVPVNLQGFNYVPSEQEYFSTAWECAVEDGAVNPKCKANYTFKLVHQAEVD